MARKGYPPEFRRRVIDLVEGGRKVSEVAIELEVSEQTIYTWRRQARIDAGLEAGVTTVEFAELTAAKRRIRELGDPSSRNRSAEGEDRPRKTYAAIKVIAAEGLPVELACRVLGISVSGTTSDRIVRLQRELSGTYG